MPELGLSPLTRISRQKVSKTLFWRLFFLLFIFFVEREHQTQASACLTSFALVARLPFLLCKKQQNSQLCNKSLPKFKFQRKADRVSGDNFAKILFATEFFQNSPYKYRGVYRKKQFFEKIVFFTSKENLNTFAFQI